jgi:hypothetical protein
VKILCVLSQDDLSKIQSLPLFFIIGRARSGTTLIRTLFDAHPGVGIPTECTFIYRLMPRFAKRTSWARADLEAFFTDLLALPDLANWRLDAEKLHSDLLSCEGNYSYSFICKVVIFNYQSVFHKDELLILGDKNPLYSIAFPEFFYLFPEAKYICVSRDYRDHIVSMLRTRLYSKDVFRLAYRWKHAVRLVLRYANRFPGRFFVYRYEDFVLEPEKYLREMCAFLGIPYSSRILSYQDRKDEFEALMPKEIFQTFFKNLFEPITSANCGVWEKKLSLEQVRTADLVVGSSATKAGYEPKYTGGRWVFVVRHAGLFFLLRLFYSSKAVRRHLPARLRKLINEKVS